MPSQFAKSLDRLGSNISSFQQWVLDLPEIREIEQRLSARTEQAARNPGRKRDATRIVLRYQHLTCSTCSEGSANAENVAPTVAVPASSRYLSSFGAADARELRERTPGPC